MQSVSTVWEMKKDTKAGKQLHANMMHFGAQITVKALKEGQVIDLVKVYGLAINYEKCGILHRLTINFSNTETFIEDFGQFSLPDAINIIIDKITEHH